MTIYTISDDSNPSVLGTLALNTTIITRTGSSTGLTLSSQGGWTVKVDGTINGFIDLAANNDSESTITIGRTGSVLYNPNSAPFNGIEVVLRSAVKFKNYGLIAGTDTGIVLFEEDRHVITNAGTIAGFSGYAIRALGTSVDQVTNTGTLNGNVALGDGDDNLVNSGGIFGTVDLGDGKDFFKVSGRGFVTGKIDLGAGNDKFLGGAGAETVDGGAGTDTVDLGGGNDTFIAHGAGDGEETIKGGAGSDTYDASSLSLGASINLDKVAHKEGLPTGAAAVSANTAVGIGVIDHLFGFENAVGSVGNDFIYGSGGGNVLNGGTGADTLFGFGGNDSLVGGDGADYLIGGRGRDTLHGGTGTDLFFFDTPAESGTKPTTRDVIEDFTRADGDKIYLVNMDSDTKTPGLNNTFHLLGSFDQAFNKQPGELRALLIKDANNTPRDIVIEGDVNGDGKADFSFLLQGLTSIFSSDFVFHL